MKRSLLSDSDVLTFSDYFKLNIETDEVLTYFGFSFKSERCELPTTNQALERVTDLQSRLEETLHHLSLTSETARREFLIAPVLMELIHYTGGRLRVEYPLEINPKLCGTLDYLIQQQNSLLVIEAKNADLERGFTQLAVELIALAQWIEYDAPFLYGAVSIGNIWQFGILNQQKKGVIQDLNLYRVPMDLELLMRILVGILTEVPAVSSAVDNRNTESADD